MPKFMTTSDKGIALLVAMGTMIVVLIVGSLVIYLIVRGLNVTSGQARYETVYEAAVAALEIGKAEAQNLNFNFEAPAYIDTIPVGSYLAGIEASRAGDRVITMSGSAIKFARAIAGPGSTPASGGYRTYYVSAAVTGRGGEKAGVEILLRYTAQME